MSEASFSARQLYWAEQLKLATIAFNEWYNQNTRLAWGNSVSVVASNVEQMVSRARLALQNPQRYQTVEIFDDVLKAYVEGIYLQIKDKAPQWTDPVWETANDLKDGAVTVVKEVGKPLAFGAGAGLVALGALYLLSRKL